MQKNLTFGVLTLIAVGWQAGLLAQEPKAPPPAVRRGEVRGQPEAPPMPRGPFRGEGRRGPDGRPIPDGPPDGPEGRGPGFGPRGGFRGPPGPGIAPGQDLRRLQQDDPEMYDLLIADEKLDREAAEKADELRRATTENRGKLQTELAEIVGKHFEARQKRRELQLKRMEEEIQRLKDAIEARNEAREQIVNGRIAELTGEVQPLDF